jgi:small subunit ribosomal protein S16
MLKIKLVRVGKNKQPSFRVVVAPARSKNNGRWLERIGFYDPLTNPYTLKIDKEKYLEWLQKGAQPTQTVQRLVKKVL